VSGPPDPSTLLKERRENPHVGLDGADAPVCVYEIAGRDGRLDLDALANVLDMDAYERAMSMAVGASIDVELRGPGDCCPVYHVHRRYILESFGRATSVRATIRRIA